MSINRLSETDVNQILKSMLRLLLRLVLGGETRKRLTELLMRFDAVSDVAADIDMLDRLIFDRSNSRYGAIFEQCRWFIQGFHPDVLAGQASCLTLLFDMNRLFEAFVASELRKLAWKQGLRMCEQGPQKYLAQRQDTNESLFLMKPDMAFFDTPNHVVIIADAKWKLLDEREKRLGIAQSDLYQMTGYATVFKVKQLALLYPLQRWLSKPIDLSLHGVGARLSIIPIDITDTSLNIGTFP